MSYTRGPWKWIQQIGGGPALVYDDSDGGGVVVEAAEGPGVIIWNERDRDLIAAAPELCEALKSAVNLVEQDVIRIRPSDRDEFLETLPKWNKAIAKAEGKS